MSIPPGTDTEKQNQGYTWNSPTHKVTSFNRCAPGVLHLEGHTATDKQIRKSVKIRRTPPRRAGQRTLELSHCLNSAHLRGKV